MMRTEVLQPRQHAWFVVGAMLLLLISALALWSHQVNVVVIEPYLVS